MMKWGRKTPSSSRLPLISHVLPTSWLSKFKRMSINSESKPAKEKQNGKRESVPASLPQGAEGGRGRFYGGDSDAFWRLSFGEDRAEGKTSRAALRSVWYESDDELDFPPSSCQTCGSKVRRVVETEATEKFSKIPWDARKIRGVPRDTETLPEIKTCKREQATLIKTPRITIEKDQILKRTYRRAVKEKWSKLERNSEKAEENAKSVEKDISELESARKISRIEGENRKSTGADTRKYGYVFSMNARDTNSTTIEEDCAFAAQNLEETDQFSTEKSNFEWQKSKEIKIEELKLKTERQRRSLYINRELQRRRAKQNSKVRVFSPRTASKVEICKIKALEDMKKAKLKMKAAKEIAVNVGTELENFAVVKCSFDPQKDFRDSMIEMIMEKNINQPEELEELLACYLTLNSDEYHDLIIKVFRQVWFDLNQTCFDTEIESEQCPYD